MRLGVLGGTFDPPHLGHLVLADRAREQLGLERVLWVPSGEPWRKSDRPVTPAAHRVAMVERAIDGDDGFELSRLEVEHAGPSYSADTLAALRDERPGNELYFILGSDALEDLPHWHEPERIVRLATLAVASRGGVRPDGDALDRLVPGLSGRAVWVEMPRLDVSATELRERAAAGRSLRYLVPDEAIAYIASEGLYREA